MLSFAVVKVKFSYGANKCVASAINGIKTSLKGVVAVVSTMSLQASKHR